MHKHSFQVDDHNGRQHSLKHRTSTLASPLVSRDPLDTLCPQEPCWLLTVLLLPSPHPLSTHFLHSSDGMLGAKNIWIFSTWLAKMGPGKPGLDPSSKPVWWPRGLAFSGTHGMISPMVFLHHEFSTLYHS